MGIGSEQVLLSTAEHFMKSAIKLKKDIPLGKIPIGLFVPPLVNAAFAVELYIKYILYKQGWQRKRKDKHDLKALFYQIDEALRVRMVAGIYIHYKRHYPDMIFSLDEKLEENKNVFQELRYLNEFINKKGLIGADYGFLMNFCEVLKAGANTFEK